MNGSAPEATEELAKVKELLEAEQATSTRLPSELIGEQQSPHGDTRSQLAGTENQLKNRISQSILQRVSETARDLRSKRLEGSLQTILPSMLTQPTGYKRLIRKCSMSHLIHRQKPLTSRMQYRL